MYEEEKRHVSVRLIQSTRSDDTEKLCYKKVEYRRIKYYDDQTV